MGKKFYVDGGILINTPYFKCIDGGCGFKDQPEDTEILNTNHIIDGEYLNIGDAELTEVSDCTNKLTYKILTIIADIVKKENDTKPKDTRPIPRVLTAENGLKLSDIARVLFQNQP